MFKFSGIKTHQIKARLTNSLRQHKPSFGVKKLLSGFQN